MIDNSSGGNGAGIRDQNTAAGATLTVRNSVFANDQEGILTGDDTGKTITVAHSKFENNGNPDTSRFQQEPRQGVATPVNPSGCEVFK